MLRITPWKDNSELNELKNWFYNDDINLQKRAIQRVTAYQSKGSQYLPHVIDSTAQLTNATLNDHERVDHMNVRLTYTMALIRFVNGILDPNQKSQFAVPLHTIARNVGLSSWFVELRHWGTHERELPSLSMLRLSTKEALKWLWQNYWDDNTLEIDVEDVQDNTDDEEEQLSQYGFKIKDLEELISTWEIVFDNVKKNKKKWFINNLQPKKNELKLITSDNFVVEEDKNLSKNEKKMKQQQEEENESINQYITQWRKCWRSSTQPSKLIETVLCSNNYSISLVQFLISQINEFDLELINWLLNIYKLHQIGSQNKFFTSKYSTWDELFDKFIKKIVKVINLNNMIQNTSDEWIQIFSNQENSSYLKYSILNMLKTWIINVSDKNKINNDNNDDWRKKKKRKFSSQDNEVKFINSLNQIINKLYRQYGDSLEIGVKERESYRTSRNSTNEKKVSTFVNRNESFEEEENINDVKLWQTWKYSDIKTGKEIEYIPKPFGVLP